MGNYFSKQNNNDNNNNDIVIRWEKEETSTTNNDGSITTVTKEIGYNINNVSIIRKYSEQTIRVNHANYADYIEDLATIKF